MLNNIRTGVQEVTRINPQAEYALIISADIPAITAEMIDWSVNTSLETEMISTTAWSPGRLWRAATRLQAQFHPPERYGSVRRRYEYGPHLSGHRPG